MIDHGPPILYGYTALRRAFIDEVVAHSAPNHKSFRSHSARARFNMENS